MGNSEVIKWCTVSNDTTPHPYTVEYITRILTYYYVYTYLLPSLYLRIKYRGGVYRRRMMYIIPCALVSIYGICVESGVYSNTQLSYNSTPSNNIYLYPTIINIIKAPNLGAFFHLMPIAIKPLKSKLLFSKLFWHRGKYILYYYLYLINIFITSLSVIRVAPSK